MNQKMGSVCKDSNVIETYNKNGKLCVIKKYMYIERERVGEEWGELEREP